MNDYIKALDTLLRKMPPGKIQECMHRSWLSEKEEEQLFIQMFSDETHSDNESTMIYSRLHTEAAHWAWKNAYPTRGDIPNQAFVKEQKALPALVFNFVGVMAERMLCISRGEPCCRMEQLLTWRDITLPLGQDLFVCAYLAICDLRQQRNRYDFTWLPAVRADHAGLNAILRDGGIAENHQHLFGSSQTFPLSWCSLMNHPEEHQVLNSPRFQAYRQPGTQRFSCVHLISMKDRVRYASLLRLKLFQELEYSGSQKIRNWLGQPTAEHEMLREIRTARMVWGALVPQPNGTKQRLDYALTNNLFNAAPDSPYRSLAGERAFLYACFRKYYSQNMNPESQWAFYLYLLLKLGFRGELIQVNHYVGFANFDLYQSRKTKTCAGNSCYEAELIRMALNAPLTVGNVTSLETRITPMHSVSADIQDVLHLDRLKQFADGSLDSFTYSNKSVQKQAMKDLSYFYVYHFIKKKDETPYFLNDEGESNPLRRICRHHDLRKQVAQQAQAMAKALSKSEYLSRRIRGIDAASNEITCPPEVFATAYRFLRNFRATDYQSIFQEMNPPLPMLSATYHVAEDFLDIASSLRAIDEAVQLLELKRGDRIGHALGLGVQPKLHYQRKGYLIYPSKQGRLDDLVWILYRGREMGISIDPDLYGKLKQEAETLLMDVFQPVFNSHHFSLISLTDYYNAMQLRGDDPARYKTGQYQPVSPLCSQYDTYQISRRELRLDHLRENPIFVQIYYHYHYNNTVKHRGSITWPVEITEQYMQLMQRLQDCMQREIGKQGIIVECNPSSNVLIGTFSSYRNHPIFRFYRAGLGENSIGENRCEDLQVCVNTDDLGVFDTSLEFEYALLFQALDSQRNDDGSKRFSTFLILEYLERLKRMSHWAVFPRDESRDHTTENP